MKVLIACEFSGIVRDAFIRHGHDAISCDLLPSELPGPHIQDDVLNIIDQEWDMMIAFPPCRYLASSGLHWNTRIPGRTQKTNDALEFVCKLLSADIPKISLENSIGAVSRIRKADQIIQPWQFGHPESKSTCFWLKSLPLLIPTNVLSLPESGRWENQTPSGQNKVGEKKDRWKDRSRTYPNIAEAMATQWGGTHVDV